MKHTRTNIFSLAAVLLLTTSCSYSQFGAVATGSSLGGLFGSSIGSLVGGPRGHDKGTVAGMIVGGVAGAAATAARNHQSSTSSSSTTTSGRYSTDDDAIEYGSYNSPSYQGRSLSTRTDLDYVEVSSVRFVDSNNNQRLDAGEEAIVEMDIYNRADHTLYNLTPVITCSDSRVSVSSAATIASVTSGQGIRYKASVRAPRRLKSGSVTFSVKFGSGKQSVTAREFTVRTSN